MTVLNFPASPTDGQVYQANNVTYTWDATAGIWTANSAAALDDRFVNVSGDTMTGALNVPAAATGTEVPQSQQVVLKTGDTMAGDLTFNDGSSNVIDVDVAAGTVTATDGTESVVVSKGGTVVATGDVQMTSLNSGQLAGFRNQLINGDLRIWQRGTTSYAAGGSNFLYSSADRWGLFSDTSGNSMARSGTTPANGEFRYSISLDPAASSMGQHVEIIGANPYRSGTTWTVSVYSNQPLEFFCREQLSGTSVVGWTAMTASTTADANGFIRYTHTFTFAHDVDTTATGYLEVLFRVPGTTIARMTGFQLEPGSVATPFEHRPTGIEQTLCERYFQVVTGTHGGGYGYTVSRNSVSALASIMLSTEMRVSPTASGGHIRFLDQTGTAGSNYIPAYTTTANSVRVSYSSADNGGYQIPADTAELQWIDGGSSRTLDAEL